MNRSTESGNRKEEILAKSKQEGKDEGIEYAVTKGLKLGNYYTEVVGALLVFLCLLSGQTLTMWALFTLYGAHSFGDFLAKYRHFNQKRYLVGVILFGALFGGVFAILFVRELGTLQGWWG
ncbi:MAG: DUF6442 family protein [Oscillospiraceae bacterium]|nr:DUF6442 family protein [Oscillospiraceae bacterium]